MQEIIDMNCLYKVMSADHVMQLNTWYLRWIEIIKSKCKNTSLTPWNNHWQKQGNLGYKMNPDLAFKFQWVFICFCFTSIIPSSFVTFTSFDNPK